MTSAMPNNLPLQLSSFIGREREIDEVRKLLETSRLVTLTGAGGCGKTRLALEVGIAYSRDVSPERFYGDGVWFVDLAPLSDAPLVASRVASILEIAEQPRQPVLTTIVAALRARKMLLLFDNCEHLIGECARVVETLLQSCAYLSVLATSREPLNIAGETTFIVPSLAVPESASATSFESLAQIEAIRLFVERARAVRPAFALTPQNASHTVEICRQLDGMPLALELAAARVNTLTVEQLAQRLSDRFQLLTSGKRTALPRYQTLRAAIEWSHQLLLPAERVLLRRLSIFAGGWTLEAAESVCSDEGYADPRTLDPQVPNILRDELLDLTMRLVEKSLVLAAEQFGQTRYRMLETIRQYASEMLANTGEGAHLADRHLQAFLSIPEEAAPVLRSGRRAKWLDRIEAEHDNMRAALDWALRTNQTEMGYRLSGALFWFWRMRNYSGEARRWYAAQLEHDQQQSLSPSKAVVMYCLAHIAYWLGDANAARPWAEESVAACRSLGDKLILANALTVLSNVAGDQGDYAAARPLAEEAVTIYRAAGDKCGLAYVLISLGIILRALEDYVLARACDEESVELFRELDDHWLMAIPLSQLGLIAMAEGDYAAAKARLAERIAIHRQVGDGRLIAIALLWLGNALTGLSEHKQAEAAYREGLLILQRLGGHQLNIASAWASLGRVAQATGDHARAASCYRESLRVYAQSNHPAAMGLSLDAVATLLAEQGQAAAAARMFGAAEMELEQSAARLSSLDLFTHRKAVAAVRSQLNGLVLMQVWAEGRALPLERALVEAEQTLLGLLDEPQDAATAAPTTLLVNIDGLTNREAEVLRLLVQGLTDPQIAEQLVISTRTVNAHLRSIYNKLDVTTRTAAVRIAIEHKLV